MLIEKLFVFIDQSIDHSNDTHCSKNLCLKFKTKHDNNNTFLSKVEGISNV